MASFHGDDSETDDESSNDSETYDESNNDNEQQFNVHGDEPDVETNQTRDDSDTSDEDENESPDGEIPVVSTSEIHDRLEQVVKVILEAIEKKHEIDRDAWSQCQGLVLPN